ncbi:MAG: sigma-70 family RNA polymerase sigma factor [Candidatus Krumholzibacteria bacterium]|nr:sigma-70 family RNA polymerase sigma factor [Candidatus Krumholzibacteria bacterium]
MLESNRDRVYNHALYCLRDPEDAQDVTQDAFVKLWRNCGDITPGKEAGWLMRVAHNLCIDLVRRRRAQRNNFGFPDPDALERLPDTDGQPGPENAIHLDQQQQILLNAMDTLAPETRSVLVMHYFQEMKLQEIAEVLDKTVSALKVQIHRARKSLRLVLTAPREPGLDIKRETG